MADAVARVRGAEDTSEVELEEDKFQRVVHSRERLWLVVCGC